MLLLLLGTANRRTGCECPWHKTVAGLLKLDNPATSSSVTDLGACPCCSIQPCCKEPQLVQEYSAQGQKRNSQNPYWGLMRRRRRNTNHTITNLPD